VTFPVDWSWPGKPITANTIERLLGIEDADCVQRVLDEIVGDPNDPCYDPDIQVEVDERWQQEKDEVRKKE